MKTEMKRVIIIGVLISILSIKGQVNAQHNTAPNLIIITTDGLRWQELFNGIDTSIANQGKFNHGDSLYLVNKYGAKTKEERRKKLMPFFWNESAKKSFLLKGDRTIGDQVDVENPHWFSYPGYSELLTGHADPNINTNNYAPNPHSNVLAYLNQQKSYQGKVIAFGAWDAFDRILNEKVSGFPVINGFESITQVMNDKTAQMLGDVLKDSYKPFKEVECLDVFTHYQAMHYLKTKQPKAIFISYGETDEWAHHGHYSQYMDAAQQVDQWIGEIWNWVQTTPGYKDNTYMLITTDHGRGYEAAWTDHGADVKGAAHTWFAIIGPDTLPMHAKTLFNQQKSTTPILQKQLAATMVKLMGLQYTAAHPVGAAIY